MTWFKLFSELLNLGARIVLKLNCKLRVAKGWGSVRPALLILHILGGTIGLLSGTVAISVRKGAYLHRTFGNIFTVAMLTLAASGLYLAILKSQRGNIIGSIVTFYLIGTAWRAGRRKTNPVDWVALLVGLAGAAAVITLGINTTQHPPARIRALPPL